MKSRFTSSLAPVLYLAMRRLFLVLGFSLLTQVAIAGYDPVSARGVDLSGHWKLNAALSDDAEALLQKRLEDERKRQEAWLRRARSEGAVLIPDPEESSGPSTPEGRTARTSPGAAMRKRRDDELRKMLGISNTLHITQAGAKMGIDSQVEARRFEAGTRSQVSMPQGELADSEVGWDGDWFVISRRVRGGPRVIEKYRWLKKTDQLESTIAWSGDSLLAGIKVRRIYDRVVGDVAPPNPELGPVR